MKITDEINAKINELYDAGYRGNANTYRGMRVADEDHLTALIIQSAPYIELPSIHDLDQSHSVYGMIARYIKSTTPENAVDLSDHLASLFVKYYQGLINRLMEDKHRDSSANQSESGKFRTDINRDIHSFNKQRI